MIDETYEFIEGLDSDDDKLMCEELGDVLLQIVFHACVKAEDNVFNMGDVINGICRKMILRHPHVFGNVTVADSGEVLENWEQIKNVEKQRKTPFEQLDSISKALPSLMRAAKLQSKSEKTGLSEKHNVEHYVNEIKERAAGLSDENPDAESVASLMFDLAGVARCIELDPEELLYRENDKFLEKFRD